MAPPASFAEWYAAYPRHTARLAAERAYLKALKRPGVTAETLLAGARRYAADRTRDPAFTAHPATWLNRGSWEDEGPARPERVVPNRHTGAATGPEHDAARRAFG